MGDVRKLIEAVEGGKARPGDYGHPDVFFMEVWPPTVSGQQLWECASRAYDGSLDAAKALHDALLPGWRWRIEARAVVVCRMMDDFTRAGCADNPARAWLLAILRALEGGDHE